MKKLFSIVLVLLSCVCLLLSFTACGESSSGGGHIVYETKYINANTLDETKDDYYILHANGRGEYHYSRKAEYGMGAQSYTISFQYTYVDVNNEAIACFFDSVKYDSNDSSKSVHSTWNQLLTVSSDVICTKGGFLYVSESYLETLPNFGK